MKKSKVRFHPGRRAEASGARDGEPGRKFGVLRARFEFRGCLNRSANSLSRDTANTRSPEGSRLGPKDGLVSGVVAPSFVVRKAKFMTDSRFAFVVRVLFGSSPMTRIRFVFIVGFSPKWNRMVTRAPPSGRLPDGGAAVELDDLPGHGEAEPGALPDRLSRKEGLEKLGLVRRGNTGARIVKLGDELRTVDTSPQRERAALGGGMTGIHEYVDQRLRHLVAVERELRHGLAPIAHDDEMLAGHFVLTKTSARSAIRWKLSGLSDSAAGRANSNISLTTRLARSTASCNDSIIVRPLGSLDGTTSER